MKGQRWKNNVVVEGRRGESEIRECEKW